MPDDIWNYFVDNDHLIVVTDKQTAGRGQRGIARGEGRRGRNDYNDNNNNEERNLARGRFLSNSSSRSSSRNSGY